MVSERADATALRQFVHVTLQPVLRIVAAELSRVLEIEVVLDLRALAAADVQGRARIPGAGRQRHGTGAGSGRSAPADGHGLMASCLTGAEPEPLSSPADVLRGELRCGPGDGLRRCGPGGGLRCGLGGDQFV